MESVFLNDLAVRVCTFRELNMSNWSLKDIPTSYTPSRLPTFFLYFLSTALNDFNRWNLKTIQEKNGWGHFAENDGNSYMHFQ